MWCKLGSGGGCGPSEFTRAVSSHLAGRLNLLGLCNHASLSDSACNHMLKVEIDWPSCCRALKKMEDPTYQDEEETEEDETREKYDNLADQANAEGDHPTSEDREEFTSPAEREIHGIYTCH